MNITKGSRAEDEAAKIAAGTIKEAIMASQVTATIQSDIIYSRIAEQSTPNEQRLWEEKGAITDEYGLHSIT